MNKFENQIHKMPPNSVKELVEDSCIFLTGVSGYVGSTLLQRIISIDPGPKKIFVLMRQKKGEDPQKRLDSILSTPIFSGVSNEKLKKIHVIPGDVAEQNLGISDENRELLISQCTHVFHSAANTSFTTPLEKAVKVNILGSHSVLELAKAMRNCVAMIHVSTVFAHFTRNGPIKIEEKLYPSPYDPHDFIEMLSKMSSEEIENRTQELLCDHATTYTMTKCMAENLLVKERGHVPLGIVRPGIIFNTWKEPIPGWVDNIRNAFLGYTIGVSKGIFHGLLGHADNFMDLIPIDMVVSTILAGALKVTKDPDKLHIFHSSSSAVNRITWGEHNKYLTAACRKYPSEVIFWYQNPKMRPLWRYYIVTYLFQILPALIISLIDFFQGTSHGAELLCAQRKFMKANVFMQLFALNNRVFDNKNAMDLQNILPEEEREIHPMDPAQINWKNYIENCYLGLRRYYAKESVESSEKARQNLRRLKIISTCSPVAWCVFIWCLLSFYGCSFIIAGIFSTFIVLFFKFL